MFTKDCNLADIKRVDPKLCEICILILDQLSIMGTLKESELEEYLQFYAPIIRTYRHAGICCLQEMGYITYNSEGLYSLTAKWKLSDGLDLYSLDYVDYRRQSNL